ncbi:MAG TPA: hypothetical protein VJN92_20650 [Candidatus Acidoferrum sp.]|nr:hypothetical protein [Candidatus Acidoferrum sp.]
MAPIASTESWKGAWWKSFTGGEFMRLRGMSVSSFLPRAGKWKQTWVDNEGSYLDFVGEFKDGQMILSREGVAPDGPKILQRMVWKNIRPKSLTGAGNLPKMEARIGRCCGRFITKRAERGRKS